MIKTRVEHSECCESDQEPPPVFNRGAWHWKFDKNFSDLQCLCFNLGAKPYKASRGDGLVRPGRNHNFRYTVFYAQQPSRYYQHRQMTSTLTTEELSSYTKSPNLSATFHNRPSIGSFHCWDADSLYGCLRHWPHRNFNGSSRNTYQCYLQLPIPSCWTSMPCSSRPRQHRIHSNKSCKQMLCFD